MGSSDLEDPYESAVDAAKEAIQNLGQQPGENTFSMVFTNSNADQEKIAKGINATLGTHWVGASVDRQVTSDEDYSPQTVVSILTLHSDYLHFGVDVVNHYRAKPKESGKKAAEHAMKKVKSDKYVDSYVQFLRSKKQDYSKMVHTPPYFLMVIARSQIKQKGNFEGGAEIPFLEGILECTGPHVPIFGFGSGSDFDKFIDPSTGDAPSYQFANGKVYQDAGVVVFAVSDTNFEVDVQHSHQITPDYAMVTKLDKKGTNIQELNGKEPVAEYCRLIGVDKDEYLKSPEEYSLTRPFGVVALDGASYIKEVLPNLDGKTLHCMYPLRLNTMLNVLKYDKPSLVKTMADIIRDSKRRNARKKPAVAIFSNCCSRRLLLDGEEDKAHKAVKKLHKKVPFFGCYAFSEIGSTSTSMAQVHSETVTSLILYDELLVD